jgi:hypothetical protein
MKRNGKQGCQIFGSPFLFATVSPLPFREKSGVVRVAVLKDTTPS